MEIRVDPSQEPAVALRALATLFITIANECDGLAATRDKIAAEDKPDAGRTIKIFAQPGDIVKMTGIEPDLAAAFGGAGNVAAPLVTAPSPPPALIVAPSPTIPTAGLAPAAGNADLAAAFGGPNGVLGAVAPSAVPVPPVSLPLAGLPPAPPNGVPMAGASIDLDRDGLPWNDVIHSSNKKKTADTGRWMRRRNVPDNVFDAKVAQLRAAMSVPGNVQAPAGAAPPPPPMLTPSAPASLGITPGVGASNIGLPQLLPRITAAMAAGQLTADSAGAIVLELSEGKINSVAMLAIAPQLIPAYWARLDQLGVA